MEPWGTPSFNSFQSLFDYRSLLFVFVIQIAGNQCTGVYGKSIHMHFTNILNSEVNKALLIPILIHVHVIYSPLSSAHLKFSIMFKRVD